MQTIRKEIKSKDFCICDFFYCRISLIHEFEKILALNPEKVLRQIRTFFFPPLDSCLQYLKLILDAIF